MNATTTPEQPVSLMKPKEIWNSMPGWGIVANLTPHELIVARRIQSIRKYLIIGLVVLVLVLGGLYGWAWTKSNAASSDLASEQDRTTSLTAEQSKYGAVTQVQNSITSISGQVAQLMNADVDISSLIGQFSAALPKNVTLKNVVITVSQASVTTGQNGTSGSTTGSTTTSNTGLNPTGAQIIGSVQLGGEVTDMDQVAEYVSALRKITGITNVIPTTNVTSGDVRNYTINVGLTNQLLSHHFDVTSQGGSK